ncbi:small GTPase-binding protein [Serendipita vermifera]|nr:small GTPase-binding protein [Serendipita vermifera]
MPRLEPPPIKLVAVGDGSVGKSSLLNAFSKGKFSEVSTKSPLIENCVVQVEVSDQAFQLVLIDTPGHDEYDRLRVLWYPDTQIVLICFSIEYQWSFHRVEEKWVPEICHFCAGIPFILVGCKVDLRQDSKTLARLQQNGRCVISKEEGDSMAKKVGAEKYMECSAKSGEGITELMETATAVVSSFLYPKRKWNQCVVL